jgi:hypothetical protein
VHFETSLNKRQFSGSHGISAVPYLARWRSPALKPRSGTPKAWGLTPTPSARSQCLGRERRSDPTLSERSSTECYTLGGGSGHQPKRPAKDDGVKRNERFIFLPAREHLSRPVCQRRLNLDPLAQGVTEVKLIPDSHAEQGEREGDLPTRRSFENLRSVIKRRRTESDSSRTIAPRRRSGGR